VGRASGLLPKDAQAKPLGLLGAMGQVPIPLLELGGLKAEQVPAVVMDHPVLEAADEVLGRVDGILGFPFFARYRLTLDYQAKQMTFVPTGYQPPDVLKGLLAALLSRNQPTEDVVLAPAAQWGFVVHKKAKDKDEGVTIQNVLPGSAAAAAGLQAGDRLLTLDGRWTDSVADCYAAAEHVRPGTTVPAVVRRAGRERTVRITPRNGL
jgi:hypothetical protein